MTWLYLAVLSCTGSCAGLCAGSAWVSSRTAARWARLAEQTARGTSPSFRCPDCHVVSYNLADVAARFCANCGTFPENRPRS